MENQTACDGDTLAHAPGQLMRVLVCIARHIKPDLSDPFLCLVATRLLRHTLTFKAEGNIVRNSPIVERGVILKDHTAVSTRALDWFIKDQHSARSSRKVRTQTGDKP